MFTCLKKPLQSSSRNNSARVSGQDRKILPAHLTIQIAGFGEFRALTNLEKIKYPYDVMNTQNSCISKIQAFLSILFQFRVRVPSRPVLATS